MKEECKHENSELIGIIQPHPKCIKCGNQLIAHDIEIFNMYEEIGGFCDNEKCERYLLLVV